MCFYFNVFVYHEFLFLYQHIFDNVSWKLPRLLWTFFMSGIKLKDCWFSDRWFKGQRKKGFTSSITRKLKNTLLFYLIAKLGSNAVFIMERLKTFGQNVHLCVIFLQFFCENTMNFLFSWLEKVRNNSFIHECYELIRTGRGEVRSRNIGKRDENYRILESSKKSEYRWKQSKISEEEREVSVYRKSFSLLIRGRD